MEDLPRAIEGLLARDGARCERVAKRLALEQLRDRVGHAILIPHIVNRQNVRVRQRRHRPGLALEARERVGICGHRLRQDLDRDVAVEPGVPRAVHLSHSARAERSENLVGAQAGALGKSHVSEMIPVA